MNLEQKRSIIYYKASQGKTIEEAMKNLKEALELYVQNETIIQPKEIFLTTLEVVV